MGAPLVYFHPEGRRVLRVQIAHGHLRADGTAARVDGQGGQRTRAGGSARLAGFGDGARVRRAGRRAGRLQGLLFVERIGWLIRVCAGGLDGVTAGTAESAVTEWRLSRSGHGGVSGRHQGPGEAEELQREPVGVAVAAAQLRGDAGYPVQVQDPDDGVADGGLGLVRAADAAGILPEADITDVLQVYFDGPVAAEVCEQVSGAGLARGQAGDAEDGDGAEELPVRAVTVALDQEHLPDVREQRPDAFGGRQGLDDADVDAAVPAVRGPGLDGD